MQGKALPEPNAMTPFYAGIDVSKAFLDVHLHPCGETLRVANDRHGMRRLKRRLAGLAGVHVMMEATGKHHRAAWRSLSADGFKVTVTDPLRARLFARACGTVAKTDRLDARLLALMAEALEPDATALPGPGMEALQELVNAQAAAKAEATALANRHAAAETAFLRTELTRLRSRSAMSRGSTPRSSGASAPIPNSPVARPSSCPSPASATPPPPP